MSLIPSNPGSPSLLTNRELVSGLDPTTGKSLWVILIIIVFISMASDSGFPFIKFPLKKKSFILAVEKASQFMN